MLKKKYIIAGLINLLWGGGNLGKVRASCWRYEIQYTE